MKNPTDPRHRVEDANAERRRDARMPVSPPAQIRKITGSERVEVVNASYRGLYLRCPNGAPPLNQLFKIRIQLPKTHIDLNAVAVRVVVDSLGRPGIGVRFFALGGEDKRQWESYIAATLAPRVAA
jgi:hypothetical protein